MRCGNTSSAGEQNAASESVHHKTRNETNFVREIVLTARFCDEQDVFNGFADAQFLRNQDDSRTAAITNVFAEAIGHGGDIVAYKDSSLSGGASQDNVVEETFKGDLPPHA